MSGMLKPDRLVNRMMLKNYHAHYLLFCCDDEMDIIMTLIRLGQVISVSRLQIRHINRHALSAEIKHNADKCRIL